MNTPGTEDLRLSEIRSVEIHWADDYVRPTRHLIPATDVADFIAATVALHAGDQINPHNGLRTRRAVEIHVVQFAVTRPYWWTSPDLGRGDGTGGARVIEAALDRTIAWQCRRFIAEMSALAEAEAA